VPAKDGGQPLVQRQQPLRQRLLRGCGDGAMGDMDEAVAVGVDQAPAGAGKRGVDPEDGERGQRRL